MTDLTAATLLDQAGVDIEGRLRESQALGASDGGQHRHLLDGAYGRLAGLARGFLVTDLAAVLLAGLGKTQELIKAAEHTRDNDESETVELDGKQLSLVQHPSVDLLVQEQRVRTITFGLAIDIHIVTLAASVTHARIVELSSGTADLHVSFSLGELLLGEARGSIDPHLEIDLGRGWDLLPVLESAPRNAPALPGADTAG